MQKCFDGIFRLEFATATKEDEHGEVATTVLTTDIIAMISPEGEKVALGRGLRARGNVEDWLGKVEESMFITLRKRMKLAIVDLESRGRELFIFAHPSQVLFLRTIYLHSLYPHNVINKCNSLSKYFDNNHLSS